MIDVFEEVKSRVSMLEVAEQYGFKANRAGFICCPFHNEKTPSLKLYDWHFHCFGCGKGGDVIDFVSQLYGLTPLDAVRQLDRDFGLHLPLDRSQTAQERTQAAQEAKRRRELASIARDYETWRRAMLDKLTAVFLLAHLTLRDCQNLDKLTEAEVLAIKWREAFEYWGDCLLCGNMAAQIEIFRDRRAVSALCNRILSDSGLKSKTA